MLGRRKDQGDGEGATGLVLENQTSHGLLSGADTRMQMADLKQHLTLRVTYADGSTADVECDVRGLGLPFTVGEQVPVLVSSRDRTSVKVDVDAVKSQHKAQAAANDEWNRDMGELQRKRATGEISEADWESEAERMLFEDD